MMESPGAYPPVPVANSQLRTIHSSVIGDEYQIKIWLPQDYFETTTPCPVLYLLDGDHAFAMATDIVQYLTYGEHIPNLIIASPAYGSKKLPHEGGKNMRRRDFNPLPAPQNSLPSGGVQYLQFLEEEFIPIVEANYRTAPADRTLWGYSLSAIFALYALFQKPYLFQRYIIVDGFHPSFCGMEKEYADHHTDLPVRLFISAPPGQWGSDLQMLLNTLKERAYPGFQGEFVAGNEIGHFAQSAEGLTKGLVSVFRV